MPRLIIAISLLVATTTYAGEQREILNLCKVGTMPKNISTEVQVYNQTDLSQGNLKGSSTYNEIVLKCNRQRDSMGSAINQRLPVNKQFQNDLSERMITGSIKYMNFYSSRYGYSLKRNSSMWEVIVPLEFTFPRSRDRHLDIPIELADNLKIRKSHCSTTTKNPKGKITRGLIGRKSCRLILDESIQGKPLNHHLMKFWQEKIQFYWSKPWIQFKTPIVNLNEVSTGRLNKFKRANAIWTIKMNLKPNSRATYLPTPINSTPHLFWNGKKGSCS